MSADYLIPLVLGLVMLAAPALLLGLGLLSRTSRTAKKTSKAHRYSTALRQSYTLSRTQSWCCLFASLFAALAAGLGMAVWLPLSPADNALLATLAGPLLWAALLVVLLARARWRRDCLLTSAAAVAVLAGVAAPLFAG